ncbi:MAG: hypothetical protein M3Q73_02825, partial [bacterium]|nr:hypothetical protein [bacterium]
YIPGVVPQYITVLPEDPLSSAAPVQCYIYRSNGIDYMIIAYRGAESFNAIGTIWERPNPSDSLRAKHITVYSPGAGTAAIPW